MIRGLVFGKFYPLHIGHIRLIEYAAANCDFLTVLVCASDRELIAESTRVKWLRDTFAKKSKICIKGFSYREEELPNRSETDYEVSRLWAESFNSILEPVDLIFSGEDYGDIVAHFMRAKHIRIKRHLGISATGIRKDILAKWEWIGRQASLGLVKKVILLGTESTGKSTLAKHLAEKYSTSYVNECGRDLIQDSQNCSIKDLIKVAIMHARNIERQSKNARRVLIIDTDLSITESYARYLHGQDLIVSSKVRELNRGDLYLYLDNDAPFVQDGTRMSKHQRDELDSVHKATLATKNISYHLLRGSWHEKYFLANQLVEQYSAFP